MAAGWRGVMGSGWVVGSVDAIDRREMGGDGRPTRGHLRNHSIVGMQWCPRGARIIPTSYEALNAIAAFGQSP